MLPEHVVVPLTMLIVGKGFTVPIAATSCSVAGVDVQATLPAGVPLAVAAMRTETVVVATVPDTGVMGILEL